MRYFSLFSGVGGFEIGIENAYANKGLEHEPLQGNSVPGRQEAIDRAGMDNKLSRESCGDGLERGSRPTCIGQSEIDHHASAVLKHRFPNVTNYGDISKIDWSRVPDFDLLVGGSPCQDLSVAGKRAGLGGVRSGLFREYVRALKEKKPANFIWENVKGALSSNGGRDFGTVLSELAEAGYSLWWQVLNAKDFGVPQNRERVFVVGTRSDLGSPREVFFERGAAGEDNRKDVSYALKARADSTIDRKHPQTVINVREAPKQGYAVAEEGDSVNYAQPNSSTRRGRVGRKLANTLDTSCEQGVVVNRGELKPSEQANALDANYHKGPDNHGQRTMVSTARTDRSGGQKSPHGSKQNWDSYEVEGRIRRLMPVECERLMSWPDGHTSVGDYGDGKGAVPISDTQRYKMCGNGVVSRVVEEVVRAHLL